VLLISPEQCKADLLDVNRASAGGMCVYVCKRIHACLCVHASEVNWAAVEILCLLYHIDLYDVEILDLGYLGY